jgi:hypothetical protein
MITGAGGCFLRSAFSCVASSQSAVAFLTGELQAALAFVGQMLWARKRKLDNMLEERVELRKARMAEYSAEPLELQPNTAPSSGTLTAQTSDGSSSRRI